MALIDDRRLARLRGVVAAPGTDPREEKASATAATAATEAETPRGPPSAPPTKGPGFQVGRYQLREILGAGGMGVVYLAHDPELDREVAVKVLRRQPGASLANATRLLREAQALARLHHPNVVAVHDAGRVGGEVYIAMERVVGTTLSTWLERHAATTDWPRIVELIGAAGDGLAAAHAAGLVHRDVKPDNILVGDDGRPRMVDFGLAREPVTDGSTDASTDTSTDADANSDGSGASTIDATTDAAGGRLLATPLTAAGIVCGTPGYVSPEQLTDRPATARSDQFSFCVTLYVALHGVMPFGGQDRKTLLAEIAAGPPPPPATGRRLPDWLDAAIARGLAFDPAGRHASMDDLLGLLRACLAPPRPPARPSWRWGVAAALLLMAGLGGAALLLRARARPAVIVTQAPDPFCTASVAVARMALEQRLSGPFAAAGSRDVAKVAAQLAEHSDRLQEKRTALCAQQGGLQPRLYRARQLCLDLDSDELHGLVELLASGDGALVQQAAAAVRGLPAPARCDDASGLFGRVKPPPPARRAAVQRLRHRLAEAKALRHANKLAASLELAREVAGEVKAVGYRPLEAESLYIVALDLYTLGRWRELDPVLEQTQDAAEAGGHDEILLHALSVEATAASQNGQFERAERANVRSRALLERIGPQLESEGIVESTFGTVRHRQGKYAEALAYRQRALALFEKGLWPTHFRLIAEMGNLAGTLAALGRVEEARELQERALALTERRVGPRHLDVALTLHALTDLHRRLGRLDEARAAGLRALQIRQARWSRRDPRLAALLRLLSGVLDELARRGDADPTTLARAQWEVARALAEQPALASRAVPLAQAALATLRTEPTAPTAAALAAARVSEPAALVREIEAWLARRPAQP